MHLYRPGDNCHSENSHVLPALIRRFHEARQRGDASVAIWGTGTPCREFPHVDDLADAAVFLMQNHSGEQFVKAGTGTDLTILELAQLVADVVGFTGAIVTDPAKPDGTPRKLLDVSRLATMGWKPRIGLREGVAGAYAWYLENAATARG